MDGEEQDHHDDQDQQVSLGTGNEQIDALKLYAFARNVPGAERPALKLPGDNVPIGGFAKAFWMLVRERGVFRRDSYPVLVNLELGHHAFMDPHMLMVWADETLDLVKIRARRDGDEIVFTEVRRSMTVEVAKGLQAQVRVQPSLLHAVERWNSVPMPVFRPGGKLELLPNGYDKGTKTFTFPSEIVLDETMTKDAAVTRLREFFAEFPFGDGADDPERSLAVMVACMLTLFCAAALPPKAMRPVFIFNANTSRSGKSLLAKIALFVIFGKAHSSSWSENREEFRKMLETAVNTGAPFIFYDNVKAQLSSADLERFVTSPEVTCRMMGKNTEEITVPNVSTVLVTGNQTTTSVDLAERSLFINLFVNEADAQARKIDRPISEVQLVDVALRTSLLSSLWALVRHWHANGAERHTETSLVGFEEWSAIIGGIVKAAGFADALQRPNIQGVGDEFGSRMRKLVEILVTRNEDPHEEEIGFEISPDGVRSYNFAMLIKICSANGLFDEFIPEDGDMTPKDRSRFGKKLKSFISRGRTFNMELAGVARRVEIRIEGDGHQRRFILQAL